MTIVTIHQPMYLPYPGIFNKIKSADVFVFLDDAIYSSGYYYNRNMIRGPNGGIRLTVPVRKKKGIKLNEIEIAQNIHWQDKHWKSLVMNYEPSNYFKDYKDYFSNLYQKEWTLLHDMNIDSMSYLMEQLKIKVPCYLSSKLLKNEDLTGTERLIEICKKLKATIYLSGVSGRDYVDEARFKEEGIELKYQNYKPLNYKQRFLPFIPNLSVVDLLFNMGEKSKSMI